MASFHRYMSLLDSATSAYREGRSPGDVTWWLPTTEEREKAIIIGRSALMYRLLFGDMVRLPRNQAFDSSAWFDAAPSLVKLKYPLFSISVLEGRKADIDAVLQDAVKIFKSPLLSAWPGLDDKHRQKISDNVLTAKNFLTMLDGIGKLDHLLDEIFARQAWILQATLQYLQTQPGSIVRSSPQKRLLWDRLNDSSNKAYLGEEGRPLYSVPKKAKRDNRAVLYQQIGDLDAGHRGKLREAIDQQYHATLADSVADGHIDLAQGLVSELPFEDVLQLGNVGDRQYDPQGLTSIYTLTLEHQESGKDTPLSWDHVVQVLNDDDFQRNLVKLRLKLQSTDRAEVYDAALGHLKYLEQFIPLTVVTSTNVRQFSIKFLQGKKGEYLVEVISDLASALGAVGFEILKKYLQEKEAGRVQKVLAGRIRDWLQPKVAADYQRNSEVPPSN